VLTLGSHTRASIRRWGMPCAYERNDFRSTEAVYWDASGRVHVLSAFLRAMGVDLAGWTLLTAYDVSADGRTIVGTGINPSGGIEAWIAVVPEPGTSLLIAVGLAMLSAQRGRRPIRPQSCSGGEVPRARCVHDAPGARRRPENSRLLGIASTAVAP
jgi:hypothetical protein